MNARRRDTESRRQTVDALDDLICVAQFSENHQRHIAAPPEAVWIALKELRSQDLPLTRALMTIRTLPERLVGRRTPQPAPNAVWNGPVPVLAAEPPRTIVAAGVMQPWKLRGGDRPPMLDANGLRAFDEPGWVKCGIEFTLEPAAGHTQLRTETRLSATDVVTRARFALYWLVIRAGSGLIRREILRGVARRAEGWSGSGWVGDASTMSAETPGRRVAWRRASRRQPENGSIPGRIVRARFAKRWTRGCRVTGVTSSRSWPVGAQWLRPAVS